MSARFRFTPSVQDGETLEALFVARHGVLDAALDAVREAAAGEHRAHTLFVGPRGAGKTHLVALIHHRLLALRAEGVRIQPAWLIEDPWDIGSYAEFLGAVLQSLPGSSPATGGDAEAQLLAAVAADGPVVVLAENLDRILTAIGPDGQRRLRALLENSRPLLLMATATRLSDEVARQDEPFYGFFSVTHLEPFGVEDAAAMLIALAKHEDNAAQVELLGRPEAARRLATIAHLAGGQPRVWALLGPALQTSGIEDLVTNLLGRVDDLTPYYQEQLAQLSPQEARVVRRMAAHDRPLTVRGIAELARLDQRSVSKTISDLRRRGWIKQYSSTITELADKRHSYYQLAEPLARLAFQVKESRGQPIQLVVEFIAAWHDVARHPPEHHPHARAYTEVARSFAPAAMTLTRRLIASRTSMEIVTATPDVTALMERTDDALLALESGDPDPALGLPAPLLELVEYSLTGRHVGAVRLEVAELASGSNVDWRHRLDSVVTRSIDEEFWSLMVRLDQEAQFGTPASTRAVVDELVDGVGGEGHELASSARILLAAVYGAHGDYVTATDIVEDLLEQRGGRGPLGQDIQELQDMRRAFAARLTGTTD